MVYLIMPTIIDNCAKTLHTGNGTHSVNQQVRQATSSSMFACQQLQQVPSSQQHQQPSSSLFDGKEQQEAASLFCGK
jgi:hypothetical protein